MEWWTHEQQPKHAWKFLLLSIVIVVGGILVIIGTKMGSALII